MPAIDDIRRIRKWLGGGLAVPGAASSTGDIGQMLKWLIANPTSYFVPDSISPYSRESIGDVIAANNAAAAAAVAGGGILASQTWPSANRAILIPFILLQGKTIRRLSCRNGSVVSGNVDIAVYDSSFTKVTAAANVAQAGTNTRQVFDVADVAVNPGLYYMSLVADNTTGTFAGTTATASWLSASGVFEKQTAYPLPAGPITPEQMSISFVPTIGVHFLANG